VQDAVSLVVAGLSTGAIYALIAVGFALVWQTAQTVNFAQGEFVMVPAFLVLAAVRYAHLPFWLAIIVSVPLATFLLGWFFKKVIVDPTLRHGVLSTVIASIGFGIILRESVKTFYGAEAYPFPSLATHGSLAIGNIMLSTSDLSVLLVAIVAIAGLQLFLSRSRTGQAMQAAAQNPVVAHILGIPVQRMVLYTFLINAGLATLASILISPIYLAKFTNGETLGLAAFTAAIIGGFNQVRGAIAGGLLLGVVDNLSATYISTQYRGVAPLLILILVILFRPQGLLGRVEERTA